MRDCQILDMDCWACSGVSQYVETSRKVVVESLGVLECENRKFRGRPVTRIFQRNVIIAGIAIIAEQSIGTLMRVGD